MSWSRTTKMELVLSSFPCLPIAIFILIYSFLLLQRNRAEYKSKLPPGPSTIPFFGNLHHIAISSCPHQILRELASSLGPVMLLQTGDVKLLVLSSVDAAKEVMKIQDAKFVDRPTPTAVREIMYGCTDIAFSSGLYWHQFRKICVTELLSSKRVKYFSSIRQEEIQRMIKIFASSSNDSTQVNFGEKALELANSVVLQAAFGGKCKRQGVFLKVMKEAVDACAWFCPSDVFSSLGWLDVITKRKLARIHR